MSKTKKYLILSLICFFAIYIGAWFYAANHIKKMLFDLPFKTEEQELSFDKVNITGFPFKLQANIKNLHFIYNVKNEVINMGFDFLADNISANTNLLFSSLELDFPNKSSFIFTNNDKVSKFDLLSKDHYLKLKEKNFINTPRIIEFLYKSKEISYKDFILANLRYHAASLVFVDKNLEKEVINSSADLNVSMVYAREMLKSLKLKTDHKMTIMDNEYVGHNFKEFAASVDIETILKPLNSIFGIMAADFNLFKFEVDNSSFTLTGKAKHQETGQFLVDLNLNLKGWNNFVHQLVEQKILSPERLVILQNIMQSITGKEDNNEADIKIYSAKDESIRIGNNDVPGMAAYFQQMFAEQ